MRDRAGWGYTGWACHQVHTLPPHTPKMNSNRLYRLLYKPKHRKSIVYALYSLCACFPVCIDASEGDMGTRKGSKVPIWVPLSYAKNLLVRAKTLIV